MDQQKEIKRIERRAKALLYSKNIPPAKMDVVRTLLNNNRLNPKEKFGAIIELIQSCPDKPVEIEEGSKVELKKSTKKSLSNNKRKTSSSKKSTSIKSSLLIPTETSSFVNSIFKKYKKLKLFKKRYLIHANNRFGIRIRKRLIPTVRLITLLKKVSEYQKKVMTVMPDILIEIIKDESISGPAQFNYLKLFSEWMAKTPLISMSKEIYKWMDSRDFDTAFKKFVIGYFSFSIMKTEAREEIIALAEKKLRNLDEYKKEKLDENDSEKIKKEKEKQNLKKERKVFEFILYLRSFLSAINNKENALARVIRIETPIDSFTQLLIIIMEALVFRRAISPENIITYYEIAPPAVSSEVWNFEAEVLKQHGKDPDSLKKRDIETIKNELTPYNDIFSLLKLKLGKEFFLWEIFELQWKQNDRRKRDPETVFEEDFLGFIDSCVTFFNLNFLPLIDGSVLIFEDREQNHFEGSIFHKNYFSRECTQLSILIEELYHFKENNPTMTISRKEIVKILKGEMETMSHVEKIIRDTGSLFYLFAREMLTLFEKHREWTGKGAKIQNPADLRTPLSDGEDNDFYTETGRPIPFYDCMIKSGGEGVNLAKTLINKYVVGDAIHNEAIFQIAAFSYQLAYECEEEHLFNDLKNRKELLRQIDEVVGE